MSLSDNYLDPYLFDTNDKLEFCYQAKVRNEETGKLGNVFVIADEDGNTIRTFASSDKGVATTAGCYNATATRKEFYVQYNDETSNKYYLEFFQLPFEKYHNGGDGTKQNPYLVATAGDLIAMKDDPKAFYKMVNDINLTNFNIVNDTWTPIDAFAGNFDGAGHAIDNLYINSSKASVGLFGDLAEKAVFF